MKELPLHMKTACEDCNAIRKDRYNSWGAMKFTAHFKKCNKCEQKRIDREKLTGH